jgi:PhnB protein
MRTLRPYLQFDGQCETALKLYADALGGQIKSLQRFGEAPMQTADADKARVMHAEFAADGVEFFASDCMPGRPLQRGTMITLCLNLDSTAEQDRIWSKLGEGGTVGMKLQETFWGARFGEVTDKFGISWMLNCELTPKK